MDKNRSGHREKEYVRRSGQSDQGSRRRSRLVALLLVLLIAAAFVCLSDSDIAAGIRTGFRNAVTGGQDETQLSETADTEQDAQSSESSNDSRESGEGGGAGSADTAETLDPAGLPGGNAESADELPQYNGSNYVTLNSNVPEFPEIVYSKAGLVNDNGKWKTEGTLSGVDQRKLISYENYGKLDKQGRCTVTYGCLGEETMPSDGEERGDISQIHPSGWAKGQGWERSHLIAWALGAENANSCNLITGTHYLNYDGMRPLEEETEHYIWDTGNHVLYYSQPVFAGDEQVARGVHMMAQSVEDSGKGLSFNVYVFNVTPGAEIDYYTGIVTTEEQAAQDARLYIVNTRSRVFHYPSCEGAGQISKHNRKEVTATRVELTSQGYTPCGLCEP